MNRIGGHAVVLGASMGGLLAARVLADLYDAVTVVERDVLPQVSANRRGVPQGRHAHALLARGRAALDELFPDFTADLVAAEVPAFDYRDMSRAYTHLADHEGIRNGALPNVPPLFVPSRPLLEGLVRQRLQAMANVTVLDGHDIEGFTSSPEADRVTGVRVRAHGSGAEAALTADLVVDASGRGARTPAFLESLGYGRPVEESVAVRLVYSSQLLRIPPGTLREMLALVSPTPGRPTGMALFGYEHDAWIFTVFGMAGHEPPGELSEMVDFATGLVPDHILSAVRAAEPLTDVCRFRYPESRWRRYDRMRRFPAGLVVLGDALCSFNPIYGQGMTVAALQALALRECLRRGDHDLARRYFRAAAKPIGVAWQFAVGSDLRLPGIEGRLPLSMRLTGRYVERLQNVGEYDPEVAAQFLRVVGFLDPPQALMRPKVALRVLAPRRRPSAQTRRVRVAEVSAG
ncbi:2-polyprenyl-6-methoxyphenol hydroxylase-like oxidoreductase [Mycobacterium sp. NPDC050551]|uniref:FAD-dependent oxidoreductase n=1 Tax=Mycobacterium sp. NPDC050551 TaxID=3155407 RepID=UPI003444B171